MKEWGTIKIDQKVIDMVMKKKELTGIPAAKLIEDSLRSSMKRGGFKKIGDPYAEKQCQDKEHNPPMHILLDPGVYEYECPSCGKKQIITIPPKSTF